MIFKVVKFFIKLGVGIILGIISLVVIFCLAINGITNRVKSYELPYHDVSYMITSYEKNAEAPKGTWCVCPVCEKEYYYKDKTVCCSPECEKKYHEIVKAYNDAKAGRKFVERQGKKFK